MLINPKDTYVAEQVKLLEDDLLIEDISVFQNLFYAAKLSFANATNEELKGLVQKTLVNLGLSAISRLRVGNPLEKIISSLVVEIKSFISDNRLNINEEKIGYCLIDVFENYKTIFIAGKGNKFNKNLILLSLREMTSLSTKEIRVAIKKFKKMYDGILFNFIN